MDHVENVNERLHEVEHTCETRISSLETAMTNLAHNIQGFDDAQEKLQAELEKRNKYRETLHQKTSTGGEPATAAPDAAAESPAAETAPGEPARSAAPVTFEPGMRADGTRRNKAAMQRWRWAMSRLRFKFMMGRLSLTGVKVGADQSIGSRISKLEAEMDNMRYQYEMSSSKSGEDPGLGKALKEQVRLLQKTLERLKTQVTECEEKVDQSASKWSGFDDEFKKLAAGVASMDAQLQDLEKIKETNQAAVDQREQLYKLVLYQMRSLMDEAAQASQQRRVQMSSLGPVLASLGEELSTGLQELEGPAGSTMEQRLPCLEKAGWSIHHALRTDEVAARSAGTDDAKGQAPQVLLSGVQCQSGQFELRDKMEECRGTLVEVMKAGVNPGKLQMSVWWLERELVSKMVSASSLEAAMQRMQTDLGEKATAERADVAAMRDEFEQLKHRLGALQETQSEQPGAGGASALPLNAANAAASLSTQQGQSPQAPRGGFSSNEDVQRLSGDLAATLKNLERLQTELGNKATSVDVSAALAAVNKQLSRMQANSMPKDQLDGVLKSKVDKKDINRIAAALAGDSDDLDVDPVLAAKLQMPKFRCLSCNRPLRGTGPKATERGEIFNEPSGGDEQTAVSVTPVTKPLAEVKAPPGYRQQAVPEDDSPHTEPSSPFAEEGGLSRYPRLGPPPNRVRTAVGGGGAGLARVKKP